jgi:RHS repeat-associated protein
VVLALKEICYYPFGMLMPGRKFTAGGGYRYGHGGQEKTDEISGIGNHYTAEYWEYDPRLGRRWNIDPVLRAWESGYACFANNPIMLNDPDGRNPEDPKKHTTAKDDNLTSIGKNMEYQLII